MNILHDFSALNYSLVFDVQAKLLCVSIGQSLFKSVEIAEIKRVTKSLRGEL